MGDDVPPRVVLFGGKGGVGKTTCASATAVALADRGLRTLLVSTDPAHSTGDIFAPDIGDQPTAVADGLFVVEIAPVERFKRRYSGKLRSLLERANSLGVDVDGEDVAEVTANGLVPGVDELAVIDVFAEYVDETAWDVVVFDTAPTGHTLRVLQLPDVAGSALRKIAMIESGLGRVSAAASRLFGGGSSEDDLDVGSDLTKVQSQVETVAAIVKDDRRTRFNVVTHPEKMALSETERLHEELRDVGVPVGNTIVNKVRLDVDEDCAYCVAQQQTQLELLEAFESRTGIETHRLPATPSMEDRERVSAIAEEIALPVDILDADRPSGSG